MPHRSESNVIHLNVPLCDGCHGPALRVRLQFHSPHRAEETLAPLDLPFLWCNACDSLSESESVESTRAQRQIRDAWDAGLVPVIQPFSAIAHVARCFPGHARNAVEEMWWWPRG